MVLLSSDCEDLGTQSLWTSVCGFAPSNNNFINWDRQYSCGWEMFSRDRMAILSRLKENHGAFIISIRRILSLYLEMSLFRDIFTVLIKDVFQTHVFFCVANS